jgi:preprotein translocase subunit Sec63
MAHDAGAIAKAYLVLGLQPGVSPLAARRRYRELVKQWHPDRHPAGSTSHAEATRRTQEINESYRLIKDAAIHREVPLRRSTASAQASSPTVVNLEVDTVADRMVAAVAGILLGAFIDLALMSESAIVWVGVPMALGAAGAALGWRAIEAVIRALWWFV